MSTLADLTAVVAARSAWCVAMRTWLDTQHARDGLPGYVAADASLEELAAEVTRCWNSYAALEAARRCHCERGCHLHGMFTLEPQPDGGTVAACFLCGARHTINDEGR